MRRAKHRNVGVLYASRLVSQNCSSAATGYEMWTQSDQEYLPSIVRYMARVIRWVTGPRAKLMEISLPVTCASDLD